MKPDERALLLRLAELQGRGPFGRIRPEPYGFATTVAGGLGIHPKRCEYLLLKWSGKGWWEYGVSVRSGWLTEAGLAKAKELRDARDL